MKKLKIEWVDVTHHCKTCGYSYATGANVYLNDELILECEPIAYCYDESSWTDEEIYRLILSKLGYEVEPY